MIRLLPAMVIGVIGLVVLCGCNVGKLYQWVGVDTYNGVKRIVSIPIEQDLIDASWNVTATNSEVVLRFAVKEEQ